MRNDPRVAGGRYYCGYWRKQYSVVWINQDGEMKVRWEDGTESVHRTMWDPRRDQVISQE